VHAALHLSESERKIITDCFDKIRYELDRPVDKHSRTLIVSNIELFPWSLWQPDILLPGSSFKSTW
jgi:hypothetical protein